MIYIFLCFMFASISYELETDVCSAGAEFQLACFKKTQSYTAEHKLTTIVGSPIGNFDRSKTVGMNGPMLLEDHWYLREMSNFVRERIPPRVVHAKGAGAYGTFTVTNREIQRYSKAKVFRDKITKIFVRFSRTTGDAGNADTISDVRGFAIKFYTSEGIWDLVGNSFPVFFIRDPRLFPSLAHIEGRNPKTHLVDMTAYFDFMSLRNESTLAVLHTVSPLGLPATFRHMHGFGVNTFKLVNEKGNFVFCKFIYETNQGIKNLTDDEAMKIKAESPDFYIKDLYDAIARKEYPSWTFYIQIMTNEEASNYDDNPFDPTKTWPQSKFPYIEVGRIELNQNPANYFSEVEQSAFGVANMPPGIEPSPDKLLAGRIQAYMDAANYRLGGHHHQFAVNRPINSVIAPVADEGDKHFADSIPNYLPNSFLNAQIDNRYAESRYTLDCKICDRYESDTSNNLLQARQFYSSLSEDDKRRTANTLANKLRKVTVDEIRQRSVRLFSHVHENLGEDIIAALERYTL